MTVFVRDDRRGERRAVLEDKGEIKEWWGETDVFVVKAC